MFTFTNFPRRNKVGSLPYKDIRYIESRGIQLIHAKQLTHNLNTQSCVRYTLLVMDSWQGYIYFKYCWHEVRSSLKCTPPPPPLAEKSAYAPVSIEMTVALQYKFEVLNDDKSPIP